MKEVLQSGGRFNSIGKPNMPSAAGCLTIVIQATLPWANNSQLIISRKHQSCMTDENRENQRKSEQMQLRSEKYTSKWLDSDQRQ